MSANFAAAEYSECRFSDEDIDYDNSSTEVENDYDYVILKRDRRVPPLPKVSVFERPTTRSRTRASEDTVSSTSSYDTLDDVRAPVLRRNCTARATCCVACRDTQLAVEQGRDVVYENCRVVQTVDSTTELYGRLLTSVLVQLLDSVNGGRQLARVQRKIEHLLQLESSVRLDSQEYEENKERIGQFALLVERRLCAVNDFSVSLYRTLSDQLCAILIRARNPQQSTFSRVRKSIRNIFGRK